MKEITLYYSQGSSDKVYQAAIEERDGGHVVNFAYGRRGATLQTGTKTQSPVPLSQAERIYDKLVAEKMAKGYTPGASGTPYSHSDNAERASGILPQLLNPIEEPDAVRLISDPSFCAQEKFDGRRLMIRKEGAAIDGINRRGLMVGLPSPVVGEARSIPGDVVLDGEAVGEVVFVFDLLFLHGRDLRSQPYRDRRFALAQVVGGQFGFIKLAETACNTFQKAALLEQMKRERREGLVFKRLDAPYTAGRPASGGDQLKCKFCASASFIVGRANAKRSVSLRLVNGSGTVAAGNVTIPPNHAVPAPGAVVEVRYLYALRQSGSVYQPVYLGERADIDPEECVTGQLKYKPEAAAA